MKILQVLTSLAPGGAERVVLDLTRGLIARQHSVRLVVLMETPENKSLLESFLAVGISPIFLGMHSMRDLPAALIRLRKEIRLYSPDVIHSHLIHPNLLCRLAKLFLKPRLINTIHISERRSGKSLFFLADGLSVFACDACTAVSSASARFHESKAHYEKDSIITVYNGIESAVPLSPEEINLARIHWGVNMCSRVIGSAGRLDQQKGFDELLRCLPELSARIPDGERWGVVILGEGREKESLETYYQEHPMKNLIFRLPGFEPQAARMMDAFDLFVMPSRYEGYGLVLAEAMSLGLPCVVSPVDSLPELCEKYAAAAMVDFSDHSAAAELMAKMVYRPKTKPLVFFTIDQMVEAYLKIYERSLEKH